MTLAVGKDYPLDWPEPKVLPAELPHAPAMPEGLLPSPPRSWLCDVAERNRCRLSLPGRGLFFVPLAGLFLCRQSCVVVVPTGRRRYGASAKIYCASTEF